MKKSIKIGLVVIFCLFFAGYGLYSANKPLEIETDVVNETEAKITFIEEGYVMENKEPILLYPLVSQRVNFFLYHEGAYVDEGDTIAVLDSSSIDFQIESIKATNAGLEVQKKDLYNQDQSLKNELNAQKVSLEGQLKMLEAEEKSGNSDNSSLIELQEYTIEQSLIQLNQAKVNLEKNKALFEGDLISSNAYSEFVTEENRAQIQYDEAIKQLENLKKNNITASDYFNASKDSIYTQIEIINKSINQDNVTTSKEYYDTLIEQGNIQIAGLEKEKENYQIYAPVDGIIEEDFLENSNIASVGTPAYSFMPNSEKYISVNINTRDIRTVSVGDTLNLTFNDRYNNQYFTGIVSEIGNEAFSEASSLGVDERKVEIKIIPEISDDANEFYLNSGYNIDVEFIVKDYGNKLIVSNSCIYKKDKKDYLLVIENGIIVEKEVVLGIEFDGKTIIESGIEPLEEVITDLDNTSIEVGKKAVGY